MKKIIASLEKKAYSAKRKFSTHWVNGQNQLVVHYKDGEYSYQLTNAPESGQVIHGLSEICKYI